MGLAERVGVPVLAERVRVMDMFDSMSEVSADNEVEHTTAEPLGSSPAPKETIFSALFGIGEL